jgi:hypothetical protein
MAELRGDASEPSELPPPGQRWGAGAHSVLPYLTKTLQAKPAEPREARAHEAAHASAGMRPPA